MASSPASDRLRRLIDMTTGGTLMGQAAVDEMQVGDMSPARAAIINDGAPDPVDSDIKLNSQADTTAVNSIANRLGASGVDGPSAIGRAVQMVRGERQKVRDMFADYDARVSARGRTAPAACLTFAVWSR